MHGRTMSSKPNALPWLLLSAVIIALEFQCWLGNGAPDAHRPVTAVASVLFAAPIAVRRVWPS